MPHTFSPISVITAKTTPLPWMGRRNSTSEAADLPGKFEPLHPSKLTTTYSSMSWDSGCKATGWEFKGEKTCLCGLGQATQYLDNPEEGYSRPRKPWKGSLYIRIDLMVHGCDYYFSNGKTFRTLISTVRALPTIWHGTDRRVGRKWQFLWSPAIRGRGWGWGVANKLPRRLF